MKTNPEYKQKGRRLGSSGGFFNQIMSHNDSFPVVGKGATILLYSDRHAYEVLEVNEKEKTCVIQRYSPERTDNLVMSDCQNYKYEKMEGNPFTLYWKYGAWRTKSTSVHFTDEAIDQFGMGPKLHEAYRDAGGKYDGAIARTVIPNMTKVKVSWSKVNIIFGTKQEYYDFSF